MLKKLLIILILILFSAVPVSAQDSQYQDLLDRIQKDHPEGVPKLPVMVPRPSTIRPSYQNNISSENPIIHQHYHHFDTQDPVLKLITVPPPQPELTPIPQSPYYPLPPLYAPYLWTW